MGWHTDRKTKGMAPWSILTDIELFLVGLIMAGTVYSDGPQVEDPSADFDLWRVSWDIAVRAWDLVAREQGWLAVGMCWEYHDPADWGARGVLHA